MFCSTLLYVHSSFAIILMGKRELVALLSLSSWCLMIVVWLFPAMPWVCLQFVIVLSSSITCRRVRLQTLWWFWLKDLSIDEKDQTWCFGCCQAHWSLTVGFLLLLYSALCTVEFLSLLYLLLTSWIICSRKEIIFKLGIFHANQTSMCLDPYLN